MLLIRLYLQQLQHGVKSNVLFFYRILFQRGVYPADDFHMVKKYGQTVLITQDLALENYLEKYLLSLPSLRG